MATTSVTLLLLLLVTITITLAEQPKQHKFEQCEGLAQEARREKMSHLHFYWHDKQSGCNPTAIPVAGMPSSYTSPTTFGLVFVFDDPLTEGPDMSSKLVRRGQGHYALASQETVSLMMAMNVYFTEGEYNGSTITILGRDPVFDEGREMPVVGGSRLFRLARGYAEARTLWEDPLTHDAVVEYNMYVIHYQCKPLPLLSVSLMVSSCSPC